MATLSPFAPALLNLASVAHPPQHVGSIPLGASAGPSEFPMGWRVAVLRGSSAHVCTIAVLTRSSESCRTLAGPLWLAAHIQGAVSLGTFAASPGTRAGPAAPHRPLTPASTSVEGILATAARAGGSAVPSLPPGFCSLFLSCPLMPSSVYLGFRKHLGEDKLHNEARTPLHGLMNL